MSDPAQPTPPAPAPAPGGAWAPPHGAVYAPPAGYTPPDGYGPQAGYAPNRLSPAGPPAYADEPHGSGLGRVALVLSLIATVGAAVAVAFAAFRIGLGTGREIALRPFDGAFDWTILAPVRDWVLVGEIAFWAGTALGVWALVQGIVAVVTGRGRGAGIAAVVIAALGPIVFGIAVQAALTAGFAAGSGTGG